MADKKVETKDETTVEPDKPTTGAKAEKKLIVRLLADYWDKDGNRHSAGYVDKDGVIHETGKLVELEAAEARQLVKTAVAERGDDY
jgi:hypothetical protein